MQLTTYSTPKMSLKEPRLQIESSCSPKHACRIQARPTLQALAEEMCCRVRPVEGSCTKCTGYRISPMSRAGS
jgi:hypothetical protein